MCVVGIVCMRERERERGGDIKSCTKSPVHLVDL